MTRKSQPDATTLTRSKTSVSGWNSEAEVEAGTVVTRESCHGAVGETGVATAPCGQAGKEHRREREREDGRHEKRD